MSDAMMSGAGVAAVQAGLRAASGPVPLEGVSIDAAMEGPCLRVTVRQRYRNTERVPIEAVYVFPLPEDAAVCGFRARFGDEWVEGRVQARDRAFTTYDDALMDGRMAALLDQERPNVFTASLGNLPPGERAVVEIRYVARLRPEGNGYRLTFPTTVSPRYVPTPPPEVGQPDGERVNPERWLAVPYGLQFNLRVGTGGLHSVESPSHPVRVTIGDEGAEVALAQVAVALDRDLVVLVRPKATAAPAARAVRTPDGGSVVLLDFLPELPAEDDAPREVVFLLDCSGSMGGTSIEEARRALQLCIRALRLGDTFDIVRFGSGHESLWHGPRPFDDTTLARASAWLESTDASMGGTEILAPLQYILGRPVSPGRARAVVLLTDGQVANEAEVIALAAAHAASTSVFAFGIGAGASDHLVRGVARAGRGEAEMIHPGEHIEPKVLRTFARLRSTRFHDVRLETGDAAAQLAPRVLPPLFGGMPFSLFARYPAGAPERLVLRAGAHRWEVPVRPAPDALPAPEGIAPIALCWARERIRDLELPRRPGSRQQRLAVDAGSRQEMVSIGEAYGLLSMATSYVAVSSSVVAAGQDAALRPVPVALTAGWGGVDAGGASYSASMRMPRMSIEAPATAGRMLMHTEAPATPSNPPSHEMHIARREAPRASRRTNEDASPARSRSSGSDPGSFDYLDMPAFLRRQGDDYPIARRNDEDERRKQLMALLFTQRADGRFVFSDALRMELGQLALRVERCKDDSRAITVLVLHLLERRYAAFVHETRLAKEKALASMTAEERAEGRRLVEHITSAL